MQKTKDLSQSIAGTYFSVRIGLGVLAFLFPILLWVGGHFVANIPLQGSMSAYYHATVQTLVNSTPGSQASLSQAGQGVMRDVFVGILFAVGVLLFLYQGVSKPEDYALNLAGLLAFGIALFPTQWSGSSVEAGRFHQVFAVLFFVCIGYVAVFRAGDTLSLIPDKATRQRYQRLYRSLGSAMIGCPVAAYILGRLPGLTHYKIFLIEVAGLYAFGAFWFIKTRELAKSDFDKKAAQGRIYVEPHGLRDAVRPIRLQEQPPKEK